MSDMVREEEPRTDAAEPRKKGWVPFYLYREQADWAEGESVAEVAPICFPKTK